MGWPLHQPLTPASAPQMFKGPDQDIEFIYTAPSTAVCGRLLDTGGKKEYLIAGEHCGLGWPGCLMCPTRCLMCACSLGTSSPCLSCSCHQPSGNSLAVPSLAALSHGGGSWGTSLCSPEVTRTVQ